MAVGSNHIRLQIGDIRFTSKLIDGQFPEYGRVIPASPAKTMVADREVLARRTAANGDSFKRKVLRRSAGGPGDRNALTLQAHNPEQEEAKDEVEIDYKGEELEIGLNVTYMWTP